MSNYLKLIRLNQPIGIWLLFLPCLFGIALAIKKMADPDLSQIFLITFLFFIGAIVMRSAGCIINDLFDHRFDKKVSRTKNRPLAAEKISQKQAIIFLGILLTFGFAILLQFNFKVILSGFVAMILVATYPLMKRITYYPQVFLGLAFNFGILMASLQILSDITSATLILYFSCIIWTVIYDTIYAFQDIEDDLHANVKSTAIKFRKNPKMILLTLNLIMFSSLTYLGFSENFESGFFAEILFSFLLSNFLIGECDFKNSANCLRIFKANIWVGFFILTAIILG